MVSQFGADHAAPAVESPHLFRRTNDALDLNPPVANNNITTHGSDLDWAICALHTLLFLGALAYTYTLPTRRRIFGYLATGILLTTSIYYFVLAANLGSTGVPVEFRAGNILGRTRQVFYARWIGYLLNWTLINLSLLLLSTVGWPTLLWTLVLTAAWAVMFLCGMLVRSSYKWGFWVWGVALWAMVLYQMFGSARKYAARHDAKVAKVFVALAAAEMFLMMLYPIAWALAEGGNVITNDAEQIFYAVIDTLSQGLFAVALLALSRGLDLDDLRLTFRERGRVADRFGSREKMRDSTATSEHQGDHGYDVNGGYMNGAANGTAQQGPNIV